MFISCPHRQSSKGSEVANFSSTGPVIGEPRMNNREWQKISDLEIPAVCQFSDSRNDWISKRGAQVKRRGTPVPTLPCLHGRRGNGTVGTGMAR
jgi:hypothetical protein